MTLRGEEYRIEDEGIWVSRKALEEWRDHYFNNALDRELSEQDEKQMFYLGKHEVIVDMLKMFEPLEGL